MHIVTVSIRVKEDMLEAFKLATMENARNSLQEPGIVRFDFLQQVEDPTRFVLYEVYRTPDDQEKHRQTAHYHQWRNTATEMMAEPRQGLAYVNLYPPDTDWN